MHHFLAGRVAQIGCNPTAVAAGDLMSNIACATCEQGRKARPGAGGEGVGSVPGQLPERTRDGQDWAEWAKEWREDPQGKADRLVDQWDAEAQASGRGGSQVHFKLKKGLKGSCCVEGGTDFEFDILVH